MSRASRQSPRAAAEYQLVGRGENRSPFTLAQFRKDNADSPLPESFYRALRSLGVGEIARHDQGAGGTVRIRRVS